MDSASDSSNGCLTCLGSVYIGSRGGGGGGGDGGDMQVYVFAVNPDEPSVSTHPWPGALRIKLSRMSRVETDVSLPLFGHHAGAGVF